MEMIFTLHRPITPTSFIHQGGLRHAAHQPSILFKSRHSFNGVRVITLRAPKTKTF